LLCEEFAEFRDFPEVSGVSFHEGEESAEAIPAVFGVFVIAEADDESVEESVDGVWAVFERDGVGAAEPLHEEAHGGDVIASFEECGDDLSEAAGGAEVLDVLSPEGDIAGGFAGFAPECEDFGDADGSFDGAGSFDGCEVVNGGGGVGVPFFGDAAEVVEDGIVEIWSAAGRRFAHGECAGIEELSDEFEEDFDAVIGDGVFAGGEEWEEALEAEDAPGVSESSALDAAVPEFDDFGDESACLVEFAFADEAIEHDESGLDFGFEAGGEAGDEGGFFAAGLFVAHAGEHPREVTVLDLVSAVLGEEHIEVVSDVSEGLASFAGEFFKSASAFALGDFEESLVELVALACDDWEECGE
jgi:hypothetical protein